MDEGLYLLSTFNSSLNTYLPSHFQLFYHYLPSSIMELRFVRFGFEIFSILILTLTYAYYKIKYNGEKSVFTAFLIFSQSFFFNYNSKSFSYHDIITLSTYLLLALLIICINTNNKYLKKTLPLLSGILLFIQFLTKFTTPLILYPVLLLLYHTFNKKDFVKYVIGSLVGILTSFFIYFLYFDFIEFYNKFSEAIFNNLESGHSTSLLVNNLLAYFLFLISFGLLIYSTTLLFNKILIQNFLLLLTSIFLIILFHYYLIQNKERFLSFSSFLLLIPSVHYLMYNGISYKKLIIISTIILLPSIIIIGTNAEMEFIHNSALAIWFVPLILIPKRFQKLKIINYSLFILISIIVYYNNMKEGTFDKLINKDKYVSLIGNKDVKVRKEENEFYKNVKQLLLKNGLKKEVTLFVYQTYQV